MRFYGYVGPEEIRRKAKGAAGAAIATPAALLEWLRATGQQPDESGLTTVTFVVDEVGRLRVADRRSEHVACAGGGRVRAAGEMAFAVEKWPGVVEVSNYSTGYCPEPECWPEVAQALDIIPLAHPGRFTRPVLFRRCPKCGQRNVVKDEWFVCAVCGTELPPAWNFA